MTKKTGIIATISALVFLCALIWLARSSPIDPNAKHGPMELFGMGPELFAERASAWVKGLSEIVKTGISELGIIVAAIVLFLQNARNGRQIKDQIAETKQEMAQRFSDQGQKIHEVALATKPNGLPIHEVEQPEVIAPAPT